ncbi:alkaline phosphatase PhoX [Marinicella sp. W31]|uniref:alkaline phosphatase PhoX n=1 Tax=Marinicella sp. W31 TaxID=3023713 RepID=UPI0037574A0F
MKNFSRREFIKRSSAIVASGLLISPLSALYARELQGGVIRSTGFGALSPKLPENAADLTQTVLGDLSSTAFLDLPPDFRYWAVSITGQTMTDNTLVPGDHDGMAAFAGPNGTIIVVRNHELSPGEDEFGNTAGVDVGMSNKFDTGASGGTTHMIFDSEGQLQQHFASLGGTIRNCAGGPTPWNTWVTCEENTSLPGGDLTQKHGYAFEVPASATGPVSPIALTAMGRFNREAVAVDPKTSYVYQSEDRGDGCFYRFRPNTVGDLSSGTLEAMVITGSPSLDTSSGQLQNLGQAQNVEWVELTEPDPAEDTLRTTAQGLGAAIFSRGEGMWYGNGLIYFCCTDGGDAGNGQIWAYNPANDTVTLFVESTDANELESPDNITVGPGGLLYLAEDGDGSDFIVGVNTDGRLFQFARNARTTAEFTGVCFSPNGRFMFVNDQGLGVTFVIEGPWDRIFVDGFDTNLTV